ncbi:GIY-YIG nuclease family protein [Iningainema tapete]|uniref:GIY-YIG nuclease family protein n=1 Tax=Iningainema tapete BLCC-T55 TaxID=2748662 RepID=A0A8J6XFU5_9CYAN|nr:GIY-YIG nuclease family protein [Iningainema tapete]MBD2773303.1 GIY-YIG nuclease family protein [Iningainema tapete BLCC-T55]
MTETEIREEADKILEILISKPFAECFPLTRDFKQLPTSPGIYALKSRDEKILYIGKSGGIRARFRSGHNALTQAFFDRLDPTDLRIAVFVVTIQRVRLLSELESLILQKIDKPRYNSRIPSRE